MSFSQVDGVAPSRMVGVSASVNLPLYHKVQKFSSGTGSPGWCRKKGRKTVVVVVKQTSRWVWEAFDLLNKCNQFSAVQHIKCNLQQKHQLLTVI